MSAVAGTPRLHRDLRRGIVGGVLAGLARRTEIDPVVLRVVFVVAAVASGGLALLGYLVAWAALPAEGDASASRRVSGHLPRIRVRSDRRVATGVGLLTLSALLAFRQLGIWWSDALVWPLVLAAFGAALLWGRSRVARTARERARASGVTDLYRGGFGVLLVIGAALLFLSSNHVLGGLRDAAVSTVVVVVAVALILAPFLWRLGRNLAVEREARIRSQERAELAAHLHDSVLQTLTLMQKRADDPREVAALARRQERELRDWLAGGDGRTTTKDAAAESSFAAALRSAAEQVEDDHRVAVELVVVGDCELDERAQAVVGAAREALLNAAKHAADPGPIRIYAEVEENSIAAFVRDRGQGFDPGAVPSDRRGVRESIVGRMKRAGGRADVRQAPGGGTEVGLSIERAVADHEDNRR
jgi:signal transduction histidine kinase/phage shock protein PspC (stress-responsive transcriptional regulator)